MVASAGSEITLQNLLTAYAGESNACARYKAFAERANADGLSGVASLFRAAARAEQIHASAQARVIRQLGGEANVKIAPPLVKSTLENLRLALAGENHEIDSMYPKFFEEAQAHINATAARSFLFAMEAEKTHVELYSEAISLLEAERNGSWISAEQGFQVCGVCGYTSRHQPKDNCPVCNYPSERFETVR
ncbi:MAG: rubrerythrin family protein [Acidobacteriota bacterium]|nr:rubrerythrin family protein [Acidobacteriota bacterium]